MSLRSLTILLLWVLPVAVCCGQDDVMRIHFVDVGQANCTILEFSKGVMVVDAGGEMAKPPGTFNGNKKVMKYLNKFFERRQDLAQRSHPIDLLAITHPHKDHTSAIPDLINEYPPANLIHNHQTSGSGINEQNIALDYIRNTDARGYFIVQDRAVDSVRTTGKGLNNSVIDPFNWTGTNPHISVLWGGIRNSVGWDENDVDDENNHSLVIRVDFGDASVLFPGDIEEAEEEHQFHPPGFTRTKKAAVERIVDAFKDTNVLDADVYLASHHASHNGANKKLIELISPEIAVISCGPPVKRLESAFSAFKFGHPRKEALDELEAVMTTTREMPKDVKQFKKIQEPLDKRVEKAIYATGWDGTIVLEGKANGEWKVKELEGAPSLD